MVEGRPNSPALRAPLAHGMARRGTDRRASQDYDVAAFAEVLVLLADKLGVTGGAIFVGVGLGGRVLCEAAAQLPEAAGFMLVGADPAAATVTAALPRTTVRSRFLPCIPRGVLLPSRTRRSPAQGEEFAAIFG